MTDSIAFVDTSAWIAILNLRDRHHGKAVAFLRDLPPRTRLATSNAVLSEAYTWFAYHDSSHAATALRGRVEAARKLNLLAIYWVDEAIHEAAWTLFLKFNDQPLSFVDCTSVAISQALATDVVFGFESHFEKVGLKLRPRR